MTLASFCCCAAALPATAAAAAVVSMYLSGWDPELLAKYAADSPYISSVEALQRSPAFRSHIR